MKNATDTIVNFLNLGGPVVSLLLTLSVFAVALIIVKLVQYWRESVGFHSKARSAVGLWSRNERAAALSLVGGQAGLVNNAVVLTMRGMVNSAGGKSEIEEQVSILAAERIHALQGGFRALDAIAQIAPLLGLFGTVLGMIEAFQKLQSAGNAVDPSILAGGIWVALLTTAVGLAVAMPVSLVLTWLETRLENERVAVETLVGRLLAPSSATVQAPRSARPAGGLAHAS